MNRWLVEFWILCCDVIVNRIHWLVTLETELSFLSINKYVIVNWSLHEIMLMNLKIFKRWTSGKNLSSYMTEAINNVFMPNGSPFNCLWGEDCLYQSKSSHMLWSTSLCWVELFLLPPLPTSELQLSLSVTLCRFYQLNLLFLIFRLLPICMHPHPCLQSCNVASSDYRSYALITF